MFPAPSFLLLFSEEELQLLIICEDKTGKISCEDGKQIIIQDANYGRLDQNTCPYNSTEAMLNMNCRASNSLQIMQGKCNGKTECDLQPSNFLFGDPCRGTFKYLQVRYRCLEY